MAFSGFLKLMSSTPGYRFMLDVDVPALVEFFYNHDEDDFLEHVGNDTAKNVLGLMKKAEDKDTDTWVKAQSWLNRFLSYDTFIKLWHSKIFDVDALSRMTTDLENQGVRTSHIPKRGENFLPYLARASVYISSSVFIRQVDVLMNESKVALAMNIIGMFLDAGEDTLEQVSFISNLMRCKGREELYTKLYYMDVKSRDELDLILDLIKGPYNFPKPERPVYDDEDPDFLFFDVEE